MCLRHKTTILLVIAMCFINGVICENNNNNSMSENQIENIKSSDISEESVKFDDIGRSLVETGRTMVHHAVKRFMILMPVLFFKLGIAFSLLLLVTLVAVNNGFIGFMILVVGLSTVLARMQEARTKEHSIAYVQDTAQANNGTADFDHLDTDYSGKRTVALLGELGEEVTGGYYHEDGATGSTNKGRQYRKHFKQTYKDGPNIGTAGNNAMVSEQYRPQPTIMMVSNPHAIKGQQFYDLSSSTNGNSNKKKDKTDLMSKILPMMIMPFLISTSLIPMMLTSLKFMLLKSLFVGKIAIVLLVINALWRIDNKGGVFSHNVHTGGGGGGGYSADMDKALNMAHYGYNGDAEYGAYVNGR